MSTTTRDPLIDSYVKQLRSKARSLPRSDRDELVEQIEEHLRDALPPGHSETDTRNVLEQLGQPERIVAEEFDRLGIQKARPGKLEWAVVFLLPFGSVVFPLLGWILGVILLWGSRVWSTRQKLIGTLLPPGGLSAVLILALVGTGSTCTSSPSRLPGSGGGPPVVEHCISPALPSFIGISLLVVFVCAGIATPIYLLRHALARRA